VPAGAIVYESTADASCGSPSPIDSIAYGTGYNGVALVGDPSHYIHTDLPTTGSQGFQLQQTPVTFPPTDNQDEYDLVDCIVARNNAGAAGPVGAECGATATPTPTTVPTETFLPTQTLPPTQTIAPTHTVTPLPTETGTPPPTETATAPPLELLWGDADCSGGVKSRDSQATLRHVLDQAALSQTEPCPGVGEQVRIGDTQVTWGDWDCNGSIASRDSQALLRFVLSQAELGQTEPCPDVGQDVPVSL
jgi:hypothetical protein